MSRWTLKEPPGLALDSTLDVTSAYPDRRWTTLQLFTPGWTLAVTTDFLPRCLLLLVSSFPAGVATSVAAFLATTQHLHQYVGSRYTVPVDDAIIVILG